METFKVTVDNYGVTRWYNEQDKLHNPNGPAIVWSDGGVEYWVDGKLHNLNGPAIVYSDGGVEYCVDGKLHNPHGPAIVWGDGSKEYWVDGKRLTKAEHCQQTACEGQTVEVNGVTYKLVRV